MNKQNDHARPLGKRSFMWRSLRVLNIYQIALALIFTLLSFNTPELLGLSLTNHLPFTTTAFTYLLIGLAGSIVISFRRPDFNMQIIFLSVADISALTLMMHFYGGSETGFGILLIIAIASISIIANKATAINLAALAVLAILGEQLYSHLSNSPVSPLDYARTGFIGIGIFAAALITNFLSHKLRASEQLAEQRQERLMQVQELTEYVLQRMQTGVIVLDENHHITMINQSALVLLNQKSSALMQPLDKVSPKLHEMYLQFTGSEANIDSPFQASHLSPSIVPRFVSLHGTNNHTEQRALIFLEDISATKQQAQQMKLLSLGKLSANIAHEVRNPLGAISHATQLLSESHQMTSADQRLLHIIMEHTHRMNEIIEGILQISRGSTSPPVLMRLKDKLMRFKDNFSLQHDLGINDIRVEISPEKTEIRMDPGHLDQILWNLCGNALRYTSPSLDNPKILIQGGVSEAMTGPYVDIMDFGPGIDKEDIDHIFEPFFTKSQQGSGLGLYVSSELCEANQAKIEHIKKSGFGACFRIIFADPRRRQVS